MYIVVGLGNPGEEYAGTRHNTGRITQAYMSEHVSSPVLKKIKFFVPDTFMNLSGKSVAKIIKNKKSAEKLIVIYDDLDLPLGSMKVSYNRGSGGHRGLESIIKALKTREFIRIRIGITPTTPSGKLKKPKTSRQSSRQAEKDVEKFILGEFKPAEMQILKKVLKRANESLETIVTEGRERAMNLFN